MSAGRSRRGTFANGSRTRSPACSCAPAQRVGHERHGPQEGPRHARPFPAASERHVARDGVAHVRWRPSPRQQHDALDARIAYLGQHSGHVLIAGEQEHAAHAGQRIGEAVGPVQVAGDRLDAAGSAPAERVSARTARRRRSVRYDLCADVAGGAGHQDHRNLPLALLGNDPYHSRSARPNMPPRTDNRPRRTAAETREHVLAVAHELFYLARASCATGVDAIAAEAEVPRPLSTGCSPPRTT